MATPTVLVTPEPPGKGQTKEERGVLSERRVKYTSSEDESSGGGMHCRRRRMLKVLNHCSTPSTTSSIPTRWQTFFSPTTERKGFSSQAARFASDLSVLNTFNESPGPGSYAVQVNTNLQQSALSFSKRGTGGLASQSRRFPRSVRTKCPGPGRYDPIILNTQFDFSRAGVSSNFHKPIVCELNRYHHNTPAPNSYTVSDVIAKNGLITAHAAFKSRTPRQHSFFHTLSTPGPGQYDVEPDSTSDWNNGHQAVFQSNTKRHLLPHGEGPGPADYTPLLSQQHHSQPVCRKHRHYLCISAPAIPLLPQHPTPGPGHYETQRSSEVKSRLVSGAVFKSTTSRWGQHSTYKIQPGPGAYNLQDPVHKSFLCNINHKWTS